MAPLVALMNPPDAASVPFKDTFGKDDLAPVMEDVLQQNGVVLIVWEHHRIPALAARLEPAPVTPAEWPGDRFDLLWVFDHTADGWSFSQIPQHRLPGDSDSVI